MTQDRVRQLVAMPTEDLHAAILAPNKGWDEHGNLEEACNRRIAAIPRLPLGRDGRWWHYPNAQSYPFGN